MENQVYPTGNVIIAKLLNGRYVAFVLNKERTKVKDLSTGEITSLSIENYILNHYKVKVLWQKNMRKIKSEFIDLLYPETNTYDYDDEDIYGKISRSAIRAERKERKKNEKRYNYLKSILPKYQRDDIVSYEEIQNTINYFVSQDAKNSNQCQQEINDRIIKDESEENINF